MSPRVPSLVGIVCVLFVAMTAAGCGGESGGPSASPPSKPAPIAYAFDVEVSDPGGLPSDERLHEIEQILSNADRGSSQELGECPIAKLDDVGRAISLKPALTSIDGRTDPGSFLDKQGASLFCDGSHGGIQFTVVRAPQSVDPETVIRGISTGTGFKWSRPAPMMGGSMAGYCIDESRCGAMWQYENWGINLMLSLSNGNSAERGVETLAVLLPALVGPSE